MTGRTGKVSIQRDVFFQAIDDEVVFLSLKTGKYYGLDAVGSTIWKQVVSAGSVDAAMPALLARYDVAEATLRADAEALINELRDAGIAEVQQGADVVA
jgi:hypothetical protein